MADLDSLRWAVEALQWTKQRKAEIKEVEDQARLAIETALGDDAEGTLDGHVAIKWKYHKRRALDQKTLKQTFPDIYEVCMSTSEIRRFEVVEDDQ